MGGESGDRLMRVVQIDGKWCVVEGDEVLASFQTNEKAWRWVDIRMNEPLGRKQAAHEWSANQWLRGS